MGLTLATRAGPNRSCVCHVDAGIRHGVEYQVSCQQAVCVGCYYQYTAAFEALQPSAAQRSRAVRWYHPDGRGKGKEGLLRFRAA